MSECRECHQFFPHREDCLLIECQHGITYDHALVLERHCTSEAISGPEVRKRWPRLEGRCPLECGYEGIYYASMNHFTWGEWDGDIPFDPQVGPDDDD